MKLKSLLIIAAAGCIAAFAMTGCKSGEAIKELEAVKEKTCSCEEGDTECVDEAKTMLRDWIEKHKETTGSEDDAKKIGEITEGIGECNIGVAAVFLE